MENGRAGRALRTIPRIRLVRHKPYREESVSYSLIGSRVTRVGSA